ncbi:MAG: Ig-like domain-containing protein, partial [Anaerolineae bacterium]
MSTKLNYRKVLLSLFGVLVLTASLACSLVMPSPETPTPSPTVTHTPTPEPTATPLPPMPSVPYTPVPSDTLSPIVVQRSPARGQTLSPSGRVELVFDKPMDQTAVAGALKVAEAGTADALAGTISWADPRTLRFEPATELPRDTTYDVILTQGAISQNGEPLGQPFTFRFSTAGYLEVAQVIPAAGTGDVETDPTITVIFNRPVVPLTSLDEMEDFPEPLSFDPSIKGSGEWVNTSIYAFTPEEPLAGGITYRATVSGELTSISGATLVEDYRWEFNTVPPKVLWVQPRENAELVDIETAVTVEFNQPVDPTSAREAFSLSARALGALSQEIKGAFTVQGSTLVFTPTSPLDFDTRHTVTVDAGVTSTAGGEGMVASFSSQFTTVPLPRIVETHPRDGDRDASPYTDFRIVFNAPIDPGTVMPNLSMTPPLSPTQVHTYYSTYNNTFILNFGAQPSSAYEVRIDDGISDPYGNTIPRGRTVRFRTGELPPNYRLLVPEFAGTYDAALPARLVVAHLNLQRLNLRLYKLPLNTLEERLWAWQDRDRQPDAGTLVREWNERLESPLNQQSYTVLDLTEEPGGTLSPGVYLLDVTSPDLDRDSYRRQQRHVLVVSELNLTLKHSRTNALVWATDLASGEPVGGLRLTIRDTDGAYSEAVVTDGQGVAQVDLPDRHLNLIAHSEGPFAAVSNEWGRGISPWEFGFGEGISAQSYRVYVYTDRPIYRPGQIVNFKGVVRAEDDAVYRLPDLQEVMVTIRDINYEEIYSAQLALSDLGTFEGNLSLGDGAGLGQYVIDVTFAGQHGQSFFMVAAYRPPEFEVTVAAERSEIQRGDDLEATVTLSYFFGGPLKDTDVTWHILARPYVFEPPWGGRYTFGDVDSPYRCFDCWWYEPSPPEPVLSGGGTTDENGQVQIDVRGEALAEALAEGAKTLTIEANATGPDNQQIAGRTDVTLHPGPYYIGLRAQSYVAAAGEETGVDLVAVDWEGERLSDIAVKVAFYRREWVNTFVETASGGGRWTWETKETLVDETTVTTDELGEAVASFIPERAGSYHVVAEPADPTEETEHIRSSIFLWVSGSDYVAWRRENHDRITLISDKTTYDVGETAEILIPSPFEGSHMALVTVEREGVRRHEVVRLESNSAVYRLAIQEDDIPNIYVSVILIKPRGSDVADFKMGLIGLDVNLAPKTLNVDVEADSPQVQPGEEVTYNVKVTGPNGEPVPGAELSLDVVDKAVLSLQPRSKDILSDLYARRRLEVMTASSLSVSVNRYQKELSTDLDLGQEAVEEELTSDAAEEAPAAPPQPTMAADDRLEREAGIGGAAAPEGVEVREDFADTAAWKPRLITDEAGETTMTITLPDNLTTWTARAVALNAETQVGEGTTEVVATKPLLIRPVAPRFFVVDDRAQLAANVTNNTDGPLDVEVSLSVEGVNIAEQTPADQTVRIGAHNEQKVTWWVTVADVRRAELIFSAVSGEYSDASKPRLTTGPDGSLLVLRYTAPDIVGTAGQLPEGGSRTEAIALPPRYDDRRGELTVHLDPSLAAAMQEGLDYLEHYEYECTEQTVSRFLPNVLTYQALTSLGIEDPELAVTLPDLVREGLDKLYRQQNPDGGWGWWHRADDPRSSPYISGYVVFALVKAAQAGFDVKQQVLSNGVAYLSDQLVDVSDFRNYRDANRQAWLAYVLTEANAAPRGHIDTLFENREKLSHYARAYLAQAIWLVNASDSRLTTLLSDLNNAAILSATGAHWEESHRDWWAMNTDTRSTAIILDTLAKLDPENELIPNVVRWLMVARQVGIWETTQETAWALIALTDWMVETGELDANYEYGLFLNDDELVRATATRDTVQEGVEQVVPISDLRSDATNALTVARTEGSGRLYYTAHLRIYLPVEMIEAEDRGFVVQRRYTLADCEEEDRRDCPEVREVKLGDTIRVDLTVITPYDRYYVVVEDPLPAGGEAVDTG